MSTWECGSRRISRGGTGASARRPGERLATAHRDRDRYLRSAGVRERHLDTAVTEGDRPRPQRLVARPDPGGLRRAEVADLDTRAAPAVRQHRLLGTHPGERLDLFLRAEVVVDAARCLADDAESRRTGAEVGARRGQRHEPETLVEGRDLGRDEEQRLAERAPHRPLALGRGERRHEGDRRLSVDRQREAVPAGLPGVQAGVPQIADRLVRRPRRRRLAFPLDRHAAVGGAREHRRRLAGVRPGVRDHLAREAPRVPLQPALRQRDRRRLRRGEAGAAEKRDGRRERPRAAADHGILPARARGQAGGSQSPANPSGGSAAHSSRSQQVLHTRLNAS